MGTGLDKAGDTPDSQEKIKSLPRLPLIIPSPDLDSLVLLSRGPGSLSPGSGPFPQSAGLSYHTCPSEYRSLEMKAPWALSLSMASHDIEGKAEARSGGRVMSKAVLLVCGLRTRSLSFGPAQAYAAFQDSCG